MTSPSSSPQTISSSCKNLLFDTKSPTILLTTPTSNERHRTSLTPPPTFTYNNGLSTPILQTRRKFSFPISKYSSSLLSDTTAAGTPVSFLTATGNGVPTAGMNARRRLSNVSDVVTRKLSNTIGWKNYQIPAQDIITQGKCLCGQYIRLRLKRAGLFNRKLGLQRIRSIIGTPSINIVREVFPTLSFIGEELERMHPRVYTSVARQVIRNPGSGLELLHTPETTAVVLSAVSRDLFKTDITWGKVISLFAITGGLAVDCVQQDHADYLPKLLEGVADVIEDELVGWINLNGGWTGLNDHVRPETTQLTNLEWFTISLGILLIICFIILLFKIIGFNLLTLYIF